VDVTGTVGWSYVYGMSVDRDTDAFAEGGVLGPEDVPPGSPGFGFRDVAGATRGAFFHDTRDGTFFGCSGMMAMICRFRIHPEDEWPFPQVAFDVASDAFTASLVRGPSPVEASFTLDGASFLYDTDYVEPDPSIGPVTYLMAHARITGTIDSMDVTVIPLPGTLPMLMGGLAALALHRRRQRGA
jgi:hypothetical protein